GGCATRGEGRLPYPAPRAGADYADGERVRPAVRGAFPEIAFADWSDAEPEYLLHPADEIEISTPTAPELTRTLKIGPDGRVSLPLVGHVMAADRTLSEFETDVAGAYAAQL